MVMALEISRDPALAILPVMVEPDSSVSLLVPPVKLMALARVVPSPPSPPLIAPLLEIGRASCRERVC